MATEEQHKHRVKRGVPPIDRCIVRRFVGLVKRN
jgi:hypothetical protein